MILTPRGLDLFCGAGGASAGYARAGFKMTGVDHRPMPRYPYEFIMADALGYLANHWQDYDFIHASPPCQAFTKATQREHNTGWLLKATLTFLKTIDIPWVVENVPGAPLQPDYKLCGCMFDLPRLQRERWFETSWGNHGAAAMIHNHERGNTVSVFGHSTTGATRQDREAAMGIEWMSRAELAQAIPPPYTEYLGRIARLYM